MSHSYTRRPLVSLAWSLPGLVASQWAPRILLSPPWCQHYKHVPLWLAFLCGFQDSKLAPHVCPASITKLSLLGPPKDPPLTTVTFPTKSHGHLSQKPQVSTLVPSLRSSKNILTFLQRQDVQGGPRTCPWCTAQSRQQEWGPDPS